MMLMDSSEELVAEEHMPEQDHVDSRKISLDVINLDPLPRENMILEGAEQGGITDVRKTRRIIVATTVVFLILLGSLIGVILKMKQVRNADQLAVMDNDFIDNTATSTGIWNLTTITTPGSTFMDDDSGPNNDPLDDISSIKARRDAILLKLYEVSGEDTINDKGSAQYAAANWLIDNDLEQLDANSNRLKQRYVISLIYYSLDGPSWLNSTGFLSSINECLWYGIICLNERVYQISLPNNSLQGSIPRETAELQGMQVFNVSGNSLSYTIPESFYNLTNLVFLDLSRNSIIGTLSPNIQNLRKIGKRNILSTIFLSKVKNDVALHT
jgi:Leucine-rich repeat (LRR) protein